MKIASILENQKIEKRIAITPEIAKKYISLGFKVSLSENYGGHLGIKDEAYKELGVSISNNENEIIINADIIVQLGLLDDDKNSLLKENQTFIGVLNPFDNKDKIDNLVKKNINTFSLELLPRITRAQSMDILSSQANLAGYKAVVEAFQVYEKAIPMMMTAAGTIPAAKVLVVGAGVAGLQAIATAKRMGAVVFATDVRIASKEQVESLGGKFLTVEGSENLETEGGYAKEASDEFKKKQEELLTETLKKIDIIICTALIPGREAPKIIKEDMFKNLQNYIKSTGRDAIKTKSGKEKASIMHFFDAGHEKNAGVFERFLDKYIRAPFSPRGNLPDEVFKSEMLKLVEKGVLKKYLLDTYNGKKLNLKSNGRSGGTTNLYFENGKYSYEDLLKTNSKSIYVTETIGHGTNLVTGDYSVGATGFLIEDGEFKHPVNEITIAGNFKEMFKNMFLANDLDFEYSTNSPTMMIEGMTVAGK